jgi:hypothetical protein
VNIYNGDLQQLVTGVVVFSSSIQWSVFWFLVINFL